MCEVNDQNILNDNENCKDGDSEIRLTKILLKIIVFTCLFLVITCVINSLKRGYQCDLNCNMFSLSQYIFNVICQCNVIRQRNMICIW